jgi:nicotinamidase-related amidase
MSDTALIVIDVQESFRHRDYWNEAALPAFIARQQALIDGARAAGIPVVQIFHVADSGAFSEASRRTPRSKSAGIARWWEPASTSG